VSFLTFSAPHVSGGTSLAVTLPPAPSFFPSPWRPFLWASIMNKTDDPSDFPTQGYLRPPKNVRGRLKGTGSDDLHLWSPFAVVPHTPQYSLAISRFSTGANGGYGTHSFIPLTQGSHRGV